MEVVDTNVTLDELQEMFQAGPIPASDYVSESRIKQLEHNNGRDLPDLGELVIVNPRANCYTNEAVIVPALVAKHFGIGVEQEQVAEINDYVKDL